MKKIILLFALFSLLSIGNAQNPLTYEYVIQKEDMTAEQIYNSLVVWISTNFVSIDGDYLKDKEEKIIVKDASIPFSTNKLVTVCYDGKIKFKMQFYCRDGRFKVQLTNINHINLPENSPSCKLGILYDTPQKGKNGKFDEKVWMSIKETMDNYANDLKIRLEKEIQPVQNDTNDDW